MMVEISADEFVKLVNAQPDWAAHLTHPVTVKGRVELSRSPITHLSKHLIFEPGETLVDLNHDAFKNLSALIMVEWAVTFTNCDHLKELTGTFKGSVSIHKCGVETIDPENLRIQLKPHESLSASFTRCSKLTVLQGTYTKLVQVKQCPEFKRVTNLTLGEKSGLPQDKYQKRLVIEDCPKLNSVPDEFLFDNTIQLPNDFEVKMLRYAAVRPSLKTPPITID